MSTNVRILDEEMIRSYVISLCRALGWPETTYKDQKTTIGYGVSRISIEMETPLESDGVFIDGYGEIIKTGVDALRAIHDELMGQMPDLSLRIKNGPSVAELLSRIDPSDSDVPWANLFAHGAPFGFQDDDKVGTRRASFLILRFVSRIMLHPRWILTDDLICYMCQADPATAGEVSWRWGDGRGVYTQIEKCKEFFEDVSYKTAVDHELKRRGIDWVGVVARYARSFEHEKGVVR